MEILCCPLQLLGWAPRETEAFLAPNCCLLYPTTTCTWDGQGWKCALDWLSTSKRALACIPLSLEGDGGATGRLRFGLPHCMPGPSSFPPPHPSPSCGPLRVSGELRCPNLQRSGVGTVYSLTTLNKEGILTRSRLVVSSGQGSGGKRGVGCV